MMRLCALPLVITLECRIAAHLHMPTQQVRRTPLPLVLLWANYAAQADGMETWWRTETAARKDAEMVRSELARLRASADAVTQLWHDQQADDIAAAWEE
jgi:hypothetical protein